MPEINMPHEGPTKASVLDTASILSDQIATLAIHSQNENAKPAQLTSGVEDLADNAIPGTAASTLYPKISGKLADLYFHVNSYRHFHPTLSPHPDSYPFTGTAKLHGTHADILIKTTGEISLQSRNRTDLSIENDNLGFASFCLDREPAIRRLAARILERSREPGIRKPTTRIVDHSRKLHFPGATEADEETVLLAGEWIGSGIQRGVAISKLVKCFVIFSIHIGNITNVGWEHIEDYADISDDAEGLHNVSKAGFFHLDYSFEDEGAAFLVQAKELTLKVADACPFGEAMGVDGKGEGIVWTPSRLSNLPNTEDFWLKTKEEHFRSVAVPQRKERLPESADAREKARAFAELNCTKGRLEQAWAYLLEMGVEGDMKGMSTFLGWMTKDIEVEEKREIESGGFGRMWKGEVARVAKGWYEWRLVEVADKFWEDVEERDGEGGESVVWEGGV
ncbi:hypothetical protein LTR56_010004 [Elasticomyces elasticus]|nr:hypothetical protein LTR56_010004 [Elasticomyces elasticus]KAK3665058.1 hypothetical protein LTR22_004114 [Elasticomyces elasticus]KAK4931567.1 hypothetical protein LTR49_001955 [Elasticomyces elasticus]KAK5766727.1 hypothetical protein LTS12_003076 [Elasticomyces elasticus]